MCGLSLRPHISNTFSRDSPTFQSDFHLSKRSPRHSEEWTGKPSNLEIQIFEVWSPLWVVSTEVSHFIAVSLYCSLSLLQSLFIAVSLYYTLSLRKCLSLLRSLFIAVSLYYSLSLLQSLFITLSLYGSVSLYCGLSLLQSLFIAVSLYCRLSLLQSRFLTLSLYGSVSLYCTLSLLQSLFIAVSLSYTLSLRKCLTLLQSLSTGWRRFIGSPKLQIIFHERATKFRSLLRKMTYKDKGSYESSPPDSASLFCKRERLYIAWCGHSCDSAHIWWCKCIMTYKEMCCSDVKWRDYIGSLLK